MGMKVAAVSEGLAADFVTAARLAAGVRLDALAIRNVWGRGIQDLETGEIRLIKALAQQHGLPISSIQAPYGRNFYIDSDDDQHAAERLLERMIDAADILEAPAVRIFALWLPGQEHRTTWNRRPDLDQCLDKLAARLEPSVRIAERAGITLAIELEGASYIGQAREARRLFELLGSKALALCWDVANGWWSGEIPLPDGLREATQLPITDVQTKDYSADPADATLPMDQRVITGEGGIPYRDILAALAKDGYDGYVTVERIYHEVRKPEYEPHLQREALADVKNLQEIVQEIASTPRITK